MGKPVNLYVNTLIFSVIAGIVSLMLLLLLLFGSSAASQYKYLIVTVEVGLVTIMIVALWRTFHNEKRNKDVRKRALQNTVAVTTCPDYWVSTMDDDRLWCTNKSTTDRGDYKIHPRMLGASPEYPNFQSVPGVARGYKIDVTSNLNGKPLSAVCSAYSKMGVPWTDVRSACTAFGASVAAPT
jgi:hypothetical protein